MLPIDPTIATLLSPLFSYEGNVVVVIDGLDEADSPSDPGRRGPSSNPIIEMLEILVPQASDSVRLVISTRSEPSFAQGKDVGAIIKAVFSGSVTRYSTCLTYHTVVTECHLMDHVPPLIGSASIEDVYAAFKVVFDRQPPKGQKTIDLLSILAASQQYLTIVMIEEMDFKRHHLEELPGWGSLLYDSIGRICMSRPFIDWIQSERVRMFGVDLNRGHALLGVHLLREVTDKGEGAGRYARDFSLFHQSQALSAGGLAMDQAMLRQLAEEILSSAKDNEPYLSAPWPGNF